MGLIQRHITEDFINHVLYGDFLLNDDAMFKGETMNETLVFQYVYEMSKYYESEKISDIVKERALHGDVFKIRLSIKHHTTDESERHYLTLGLKKLVCVAADYGIKVRDYELKAFKDIDVTGEGCLYDFISDYYKKNGLVPDSEGDDHLINDLPYWKDVDNDIKKIFQYPENYKNFLRGCFLPNGGVKDFEGIVDSYNRNRVQKIEYIQKPYPTKVYDFLLKIGIITVPDPEKPNSRLRTFQRKFEKLKK